MMFFQELTLVDEHTVNLPLFVLPHEKFENIGIVSYDHGVSLNADSGSDNTCSVPVVDGWYQRQHVLASFFIVIRHFNQFNRFTGVHCTVSII